MEGDEGWSGCVHRMVERKEWLASKKKVSFEYDIKKKEGKCRAKWETQNVRDSKAFCIKENSMQENEEGEGNKEVLRDKIEAFPACPVLLLAAP